MNFIKKALIIANMISLVSLGYFYWQYQVTHRQLQNSLAEQQALQLQLADTHRQIDYFYQQMFRLEQEIEQLEQQAEQRQNDLNQALQHHQDWSNQPIPNAIKRLFQSTPRSD